MLPETFQYTMPTRMSYGEGTVENLGAELGEIKGKKAIIITDEIITKAGHLDKLKNGLSDSNIKITAIYDKVPPNSELHIVTEAAALGKSKGCDVVIGLGGGSVLDTAKVVNLLMFKGGKLEDHYGANLVQGKLYPMIFIPTTAGTGSEITPYAMISDIENDVKVIFSEDAFLPDLAVLDPIMTMTMPGKVTAATGMDALTHAIEAYVSITTNPISEAYSLYAIELIGNNIRQAVAVPDDLNARGAMLMGSFLAAAAIASSGVGIVHGISHGLGGVYKIAHGVANSIILPFGIEYNLKEAAPKYAKISEILGNINVLPIAEISRQVARLDIDLLNRAVDQLSFVDEWIVEQRAGALAEKLRQLNRQLSAICGHATNLRDAGIKDNFAKLELTIEKAMEDAAMLYNPVKVDKQAVQKILKKAYSQDLPPIQVSAAELKAARSKALRPRLKNIFKSDKDLYEILGGFFESLRANKDIYSKLVAAGLNARFTYTNPNAAIAFKITGKNLDIVQGKEATDLKVDIEFTLSADLAHYFWHGEANPVQELARKTITPKGNLPKAMRLLPVLVPAFSLYPVYLRDIGKGRMVVT